MMIGVGETGFHVVTCWMGGETICVSVMRFGVKACIDKTFWMGGEGTLHATIGIGTGAVNFATSGTFFVAISLASSGSQRKESSESDFRCGDAVEVETFDGEAISFDSSASGIQKKERSKTDFVRGVTGDEMSFIEEAI